MRFLIVAAVAAAYFSSFGTARAHVSANPNQAAANSYFVTNLRVSHGCEGTSTVTVRVKLPEGVSAVKPQMKPGWTIDLKMRKLDKPIDAGHGQTITETIDEVAWRGGPLPDAYYDDFGLRMKLPAAPGTVLYFPTVQECEKGFHRWIETPAAGQKASDLKEPAPSLRLIARPAAAHHAGQMVEITSPWVRATPGAARTSAVYMTLRSASADRLVAAGTPVADTAELHATVRDGDIMRMRPISGIDLPAGRTVALSPGGLHVMLLGLHTPLKEGEAIPLTLTFERAGTMEVRVPVARADAPAGMGDMGGHAPQAPR